MTVQLYQGDCLQTLRTLPDGSVQTCVTSPPYFQLRAYNGGAAEIGQEETVDEYVKKLVTVFREVRRVLRDDATLWLNLGDSFQNKQLLGVPWRVAFALQNDGWILRSDVIWSKPNPMPESCRDRPTKAHEYIFLLSKSAKYYYDADAVREPASESTLLRSMQGSGMAVDAVGSKHRRADSSMAMGGTKIREGRDFRADVERGRNKRSVWVCTTKPYRGAHFAVFPMDLIEPCILAGSSQYGACSECGAPWARVVERGNLVPSGSRTDVIQTTGNGETSCTRPGHAVSLFRREKETIGWQPTCTCDNADVVPCTVLDVFSGSGTTGAVAVKHGRNYIGCELNPDYIELARERIGKAQPMLELA